MKNLKRMSGSFNLISIGLSVLIFLISVNVTTATIYYSIASGSWDNGNSWSTIGFGGGAAGSFPIAGDTAYIKSYEIEVNNAFATCSYVKIFGSGASSQAKLEVEDGYQLTLSGDMLLDADNGNNKAHLHIEDNGSSLVVLGNVLAYRAGGSDDVEIKVDDNSTMIVIGNMTLDCDGGTKKITVDVKNTATLNIQGDFTMDYSTGNEGIEVTIKDNAILDVDGNIDFGATSVQGKAQIEVEDSAFLYIAKNFVRQAAPNNYGILNCKSNSTVVYNGSSSQIFAEDAGAGTDNFTYQNVTINNTNGTSPQLNMEGDATVYGTLTMTDGVVKLGAEDLIIGEDGTTAGGSINSYVDATAANGGVMKKLFDVTETIKFPVGDDDDYTPYVFTLNAAAFEGGDYISMKVTEATHPNRGPGTDWITRYWTMNYGGFTAIDYTYIATYTDADIVGTEADLLSGRWDGTKWNIKDPVNTGPNETFTSTSITDFPDNHDFSAGGQTVLPLILLSFLGELEGSNVRVTWTTANDINNDFFTVERSKDGFNFDEVAIIPGNGTSMQTNNYSCTDLDPYTGTSYYRLKQTDFNGNYRYFAPISISLSNLATIPFKIYPNPVLAGQKLNIEMSEDSKNEEVLVVLFNQWGQEVYSKIVITSNDAVPYAIDVDNKLPGGVYFVIATSDDKIFNQRLIIMSSYPSVGFVSK